MTIIKRHKLWVNKREPIKWALGENKDLTPK